jgi:undecaprenyl-diphosphatase
MNNKTKKPLFLALIFLITLCIFFVLAYGIGSHGMLHQTVIRHDTTIQQSLSHAVVPTSLVRLMVFVTYLGNPEIIVATEIILFIIFLLLRKRHVNSFFIGGLLVGEVISLAFKYSFVRSRPFEMAYHVSRSGYSFPSGHALISTIFYGFLAYCLIHTLKRSWEKAFVVCISVLLVLFIGFSRVFLGVHWASDVIAGWLMGGALLTLLILIYSSRSSVPVSEHLKSPTKISLSLVAVLIVALSFYISYYYVTHALIIRSIV